MGKQGMKTAVPRLRFPEFRGGAAWKDEKLGRLIETITPPAKLPSSNYMATGEFPIIDQSQDPVCGWTDDVRAVVKEPLPLIVFCDHTCVVKFVEMPFVQGADGIKILAAKPEISIRYLFYSLNYRPLVMEDYKRHFSTLKERQVFFPDIDSGEQKKIADCLTSLDDVIAAQGRKVKALKANKRGLMRQLFPRKGETCPRLRFPEFREAPEWRGESLARLGHFLSPLSGKTASDFDCGEAKFIPYSNVFENAFINAAALRAVNVSAGERQNSVRKGDVFFTVSSETPADAGMSSVLLEDIADCYLNSFCALFRFSEMTDVDSVFAGYFFRSPPVRAYLASNAQGAIRYNISRSVFQELQLLLPSFEEQRRIADCLASVDSLIAAESSQLNTLKTHKQGLMQQLFPALEAG